MRNRLLKLLSASAALLSTAVFANEPIVKTSGPIGSAPPLTKNEVQKGVANGTLCVDAKGLANSRGALINHDGKMYRCVKAYGESFGERKALVWVEVLLRDGKVAVAD